MKHLLNILILFLFLKLIPFGKSNADVFAQTYPVTLNTQLTPPFTGYLPDYGAAGSEKLKVMLLFNDFSKPNYQVKLKIKIEGQGIVIQSKPYYFEGPFTIEPGIPLMLSGSDLDGLLSSSHLDFSGINPSQYDQRKVLPEGFYSICITAYDYNNPNTIILSNTSCAYGLMVLNDPPYLNLPQCGQAISTTTPQQLTFNWTPVNQSSPNTAGQTEYAFELFEIRPPGQNPNNIVQTLPPVYTETTNISTLNYGITATPLIYGMEYVWRVKAIDPGGRDLFKNNGYSQICTFTWGTSYQGANLNINLTARALTHRQLKAQWDSIPLYQNYKLEYQKVNGTNTWFPLNTSNARSRVNSLEPDTDYKLRVSGQLNDGTYGPVSNEVTVRTSPLPSYSCGETMPPVNNTNFSPLTNATAGMIWDVGQFEIVVTALQNPMSANGMYSGMGRVQVGFAGGIPFPVTFQNITVSSDMRVISGKVDIISRGIDHWLNQQNAGEQYIYDDSYVYNGCIDSIYVNTNNQITIKDCNGNTSTIPNNYSGGTLIQDSNGNQWIVNSDGSVTPVNNTTLPLTSIPLTSVELDILKKALNIIKHQYDNNAVNTAKIALKNKSQDLDTYINNQFQAYNIGASGSSSDGVEYIGYTIENSLSGTGIQKNMDYKQKEFEYNVAKILNIFSREENTNAEFDFIGQYLTVGSKTYKVFVAEEIAKNRTYDDIAIDVAQLGIKPLGEAVAKRKMKFN